MCCLSEIQCSDQSIKNVYSPIHSAVIIICNSKNNIDHHHHHHPYSITIIISGKHTQI